MKATSRARKARAKPSNWLPMNSAPTNGTRVLVKADHGAPYDWAARNVPVSKRIEIEIGHYRGWDWEHPADDEEPAFKVPTRYSPWKQEGYGSYPIHRPLGWMPLPAL